MADQLVEMMNAALGSTIPTAKNMGVHVVEARRGFAATTVPVEGNGNHFGVMYAGVVFTVAEVLGGAMALASFRPATHFPLVRSLTIDFLKPGRGPVVAIAQLDDATIERVLAESEDGAKASFELTAEVVGGDDVVIARTRGDYQIRPYGA